MKTYSYKRLRLFVMGMFLLTGFSIVFMYSCSSDQENKIKIGMVIPLTTGAADFGKWALNGATIAIDKLNEAYKDKDHSFELVTEDSKMDPKTGLSSFKKLVEIDKVIGVISSGSGVVLAISPEAEKLKTIQMNHAAVSPSIRGSGDYTFSLVNDADLEAKNVVSTLFSKLSIEELALFYANTEYGVGTKNSVKKYFSEVGRKIVGEVSFPEDFTDIRSQLLELKRLNPQAVYFVANIKDSGKILKTAYELGLKFQWLTYNAFESPEVIDIAGEAANGVIYTSSNLFDLQNPGENPEQFLELYLTKYNQKPNIYAATAYDAVNLLAEAYLATNRNNSEDMREYLLSINDYRGAGGVISFDKEGSVNKLVFLKVVSDGEFKLYKE